MGFRIEYIIPVVTTASRIAPVFGPDAAGRDHGPDFDRKPAFGLGRLIALDEGSDFDRAVKSLAFGINDLCATGSLFSDQSEGWVLFHKIAQLPEAIIARVEIRQQL